MIWVLLFHYIITVCKANNTLLSGQMSSASRQAYLTQGPQDVKSNAFEAVVGRANTKTKDEAESNLIHVSVGISLKLQKKIE